jgi:hypothetical protein
VCHRNHNSRKVLVGKCYKAREVIPAIFSAGGSTVRRVEYVLYTRNGRLISGHAEGKLIFRTDEGKLLRIVGAHECLSPGPEGCYQRMVLDVQHIDVFSRGSARVVEFHGFPFVVHVRPGLAFTPVHVDKSECRPSGSVLVARSVCVRIDHGSMLLYQGLLRILS